VKTQFFLLIISIFIHLKTSAWDHPPDSLRTYYVFAYYFSNDGTLLITGIKSIEMRVENGLTKESQLNQFTRVNNHGYRTFLIRNYPAVVQFIPVNISMLKIDTDLEAIREQRAVMIAKNVENVIEVKSYQVQKPKPADQKASEN